jgi:glycerol uptake facilitator-like aquaporin
MVAVINKDPAAAGASAGTGRGRPIARRLAAEFAGTALLLAICCGSGFAAARVAGGDAALALAIASAASCTGLALLILVFGPVSGGLFNPLLALVQAWRGSLEPELALPYAAAQGAGAMLGAACAHAVFGLPWLVAAGPSNGGAAALLGEFGATFGLLAVFISCGRCRPATAAVAVGAYVMAACCWSPSIAHMNPAMTLARTLGSGGLRLADAPACILAQIAGAAAATILAGRKPAPRI